MKTTPQSNQPSEPRTHLFSPHTDQCVYCNQSAQDDCIENAPCRQVEPDQPPPFQTCNGMGWLFSDTGNDQQSRYEIERCEACERFDSDLEAGTQLPEWRGAVRAFSLFFRARSASTSTAPGFEPPSKGTFSLRKWEVKDWRGKVRFIAKSRAACLEC